MNAEKMKTKMILSDPKEIEVLFWLSSEEIFFHRVQKPPRRNQTQTRAQQLHFLDRGTKHLIFHVIQCFWGRLVKMFVLKVAAMSRFDLCSWTSMRAVGVLTPSLSLLFAGSEIILSTYIYVSKQ